MAVRRVRRRVHHARCHDCGHLVYCRNCGAAQDSPAARPGAVGQHHTWVPFDPTRRRAWDSERGRILIVMNAHEQNPLAHPQYPDKYLLARELWDLTAMPRGNGGRTSSPNQVCTRLGELQSQGLVERTGVERDTDTDTPAFEWRLTKDGRAFFSRKRIRTIFRQP